MLVKKSTSLGTKIEKEIIIIILNNQIYKFALKKKKKNIIRVVNGYFPNISKIIF